jgi:biotin carboxyl carrier protein
MKTLRITVDNKVYEVQVEVVGDQAPAPRAAPTRSSSAVASPAPAASAPKKAPVAAASADGAVLSPLGAVVVSVDVKDGQEVQAGDKLITLEAMKMNTFVNAPAAGKVSDIKVAAGDAVEEGQPLLMLN